MKNSSFKRLLAIGSVVAGAAYVGSKIASKRNNKGKTGIPEEMSAVCRHYTDNKSSRELTGDFGFGEEVQVDRETPKKIVIMGAGSYIGESFKAYAEAHYPALRIDVVDMLDPDWRDVDLSMYDVVYHVAGIAHSDVGNVSDEVKEKYYEINTDLAVEVCEKAKNDGASEFIFMSSMIVYGDSAPYGKSKVVDEFTVPSPANFYGDSKLQADVAVRDFADSGFRVIVVRPPMIYGKGSKGNYPKLAKFAKMIPFFPKAPNRRSMLFIDDLCEFLCQVMLAKNIKRDSVVLAPQNSEWVGTSDMIKHIAGVSGKKVRTLKIFDPLVFIGSKIPGKTGALVNKVFGNNCYAHGVSVYPGISYQTCSLAESVRRTEEEL